MKTIANNVKINISGEEVEINILVNKEGNIVLDGIGSVTYEMVNDELILSRGE
ncbi:hypothetical protein PP655_gp097 [Bacillus phage PBC4]|uniref:Uncharacterized protein n=1 Tax=Bacillus phage PBC4 TaxID=1675028 RepID=A0A1D6X8E2_9CAUD|nr:hypothetical protein PP655_gp097 [Bacillus phage PBC4]AKQ08289.1 hypothetical protein PBC4_097 [Bacillus phage PBC4]